MKEVVLVNEIVANLAIPFAHICQKAGATLTKLNTELDGFEPAEMHKQANLNFKRVFPQMRFLRLKMLKLKNGMAE